MESHLKRRTYCGSFLQRPLELVVNQVGEDLEICCYGGDRPHIGSVSLAQPCRINGRQSASVSGVSVVGHKDGELGNRMANYIAKETNRTTAVLCGIHYDGISAAQLEALADLVLNLCKDVAKDMVACEGL